MPVRSVESSPGHRVMEYRCEVCGEYAGRGFDAHVREALRTGDVKRAGQWYCAKHLPVAGGDLFGRAA